MLKTELGNVTITINGKKLVYMPITLENKGKNFTVDGRYQVIVDNILVSELETIIDCILDNNKALALNGYSESGEGLALISFLYNNIKLSIGAEGDIPGVYYEYMNDRIRVKVTKAASLNTLTFYIAWLTMHNIEQEEIYTWFAADPTLSA
ncbi:MAG: hypothetical protein H7Y41_02880 [Hyphomonadaceae bacterium]|nr:hypothetical protein [Clostridia bacterium]